MLFASIEYLLFLPATFLLYWVCPKKVRWVVLLAASCFFYMFFNWKLIFFFLFTIVISYVGAFLIEKYSKRNKLKNFIFATTLILVVAPLIVFKYVPFFYDVYQSIANSITGVKTKGIISIVVPLGISFYTFQTIAYVTDVYREVTPWEKHFGYYALFLLYFPQILQGPIERANDLIPQLKNSENASIKDVNYPEAFRIMLIGFFKKAAIADLFGIIVDKSFNNVADANGLMIIVSVFCYMVQLYADFSGYSDIAIGSSELFGIKIQDNFDLPYESKSIREYWNRWHITLGTWFRDYIFSPLAHAGVNAYICTIIVFLISGLWHGADLTFIIWGLLFGVFQVIGMSTIKKRNKFWKKHNINPKGTLVNSLRIVGTFLLVTFIQIFFRANDINDAFLALSKIFTGWDVVGGVFPVSYETFGLSVFAIIYGVLVVFTLKPIENLKKIGYPNQPDNRLSRIFNNEIVRYASYVVMAVCVICAWVHLHSTNIESSFIYFQF